MFTFQKLLLMKKGIPDLQILEHGWDNLEKKPYNTEMSTYEKVCFFFYLCIHYLVRFPFDRITSAVWWLWIKKKVIPSNNILTKSSIWQGLNTHRHVCTWSTQPWSHPLRRLHRVFWLMRSSSLFKALFCNSLPLTHLVKAGTSNVQS